MAVPKNNPGAHSPNPGAHDSCLFQSLYSRKVAETIIALRLTSFTKKGICIIKQKKWTTPLNSAYWISLGIKFQLKPTILVFWTKFAQKGCFLSIAEKVNSSIEFAIFELV